MTKNETTKCKTIWDYLACNHKLNKNTKNNKEQLAPQNNTNIFVGKEI